MTWEPAYMLRPFMCPFRGQCLPIVCVQAIAGCSNNQLCNVSTIDFSRYSNLIRFYVALTLQRANLRRFNRTCVCKVSRGGTLRNNLCLVWYMYTPIMVLLYVKSLLSVRTATWSTVCGKINDAVSQRCVSVNIRGFFS